MDSIDKLLADLDSIDNPNVISSGDRAPDFPTPTPAKSTDIDQLLVALDAIDSNKPVQGDRVLNLPSPVSPAKSNDIEGLLNRVKKDIEQKKALEIETEKAQLQQQIIVQQQQQQQQRINLQKKAQAWLKKLDPLSTEGFWFMDFARNFSSPLEAAIDYLAALENHDF